VNEATDHPDVREAETSRPELAKNTWALTAEQRVHALNRILSRLEVTREAANDLLDAIFGGERA
jgi:hypothetical protein